MKIINGVDREVELGMECMLSGRMYCLNTILKITNFKGSIYILFGIEDCIRSICFGRNRKLYVPKDSYIVRITEDDFELEKIEFDCGGECDYLKWLSKNNIEYEIHKILPVSIDPEYSQFESAIGLTHWSGKTSGFFGKNGYAITKYFYGDDELCEAFKINLKKSPGVFYIGENMITRMTGEKIPDYRFIEKLLMEEVRVQEGKPFLEMLRKARILGDLEHIRFEGEGE